MQAVVEGFVVGVARGGGGVSLSCRRRMYVGVMPPSFPPRSTHTSFQIPLSLLHPNRRTLLPFFTLPVLAAPTAPHPRPSPRALAPAPARLADPLGQVRARVVRRVGEGVVEGGVVVLGEGAVEEGVGYRRMWV